MMNPYFWTFDNPRNGDYGRPMRLFSKIAHVQRIVPKTTLRIDRLPGTKFADIRKAARRSLDRRRGSGSLISTKTGRRYFLDNRGNRPGVWQREA